MTTQAINMEIDEEIEFFDYWKLIANLLSLEYETTKGGIEFYKRDQLIMTINQTGYIHIETKNRQTIKEILITQLRGINK